MTFIDKHQELFLDKQNEANKKRNKKTYHYRKSKGLCVRCGKITKIFTYCKKCRKEMFARWKGWKKSKAKEEAK